MPVIDDEIRLVPGDDTYAALWEDLSTAERGQWLIRHGFRVTADKTRVTVSQGPVGDFVLLS